MNTCIITHTFPLDNKDHTAPFMREFAKGLSQNSINTTVLTPHTKGMKTKYKGFRVETYKYIWPDFLHKLGYSRAMKADIGLKKSNFLLIPFMLLFGTISLIRLIKKNKIDIVNVHWILPNGLIAYFACFVTKTQYVITLPGTDVYLVKKNKIFEKLALIVAKRASAITSNSPYFIKALKDIGATVQMRVISYPSDISKYKPSKKLRREYRRKHSISENEIVILAVGRFVHKKGFEYLLKSLKEIKREKKNVRLVLVGDGDLKGSYMKLIDKLGISDRVTFTGMVKMNELIGYYNMSDIMVTPSIIDKAGNVDGSPVSLVGSMACGIPQIMTNVIGISDDLKNEDFATVVRQKNTKELSHAILRLVNNSKKREIDGVASRKYAVKSLSTKNIGKIYKKLFMSILSN